VLTKEGFELFLHGQLQVRIVARHVGGLSGERGSCPWKRLGGGQAIRFEIGDVAIVGGRTNSLFASAKTYSDSWFCGWAENSSTHSKRPEGEKEVEMLVQVLLQSARGGVDGQRE
jgi:hypothetical protein